MRKSDYWRPKLFTLRRFIFGLLFASCMSPADAQVSEIDGEWKLIRVERAGKPVTGSMISEFSFRDGKMGGLLTSRYFVRPDANPKEVDVFSVAAGLGIYRIEGNTLTICKGLERPVRFETTTQDCTISVYERIPEDRIDADTALLEGTWKVVKSRNAPVTGVKQVQFETHRAYSNTVPGSLHGRTASKGNSSLLANIEVRLDSTANPKIIEAKYTHGKGRILQGVPLSGFYRMDGAKLVFELRTTRHQSGITGPVPYGPVWQIQLERDIVP